MQIIPTTSTDQGRKSHATDTQ